MARVLLIQPYDTGSHRYWAQGLVSYSKHSIDVLTLPGYHWKWRMHGAAIHFAKEYQKLNGPYDIILTTDMMDVSTFLGLLAKDKMPPLIIYFHENQFAYPIDKSDSDIRHSRDNHYGFINYCSALTADYCVFNSQYNLNTFSKGVEDVLSKMPDYSYLNSVKEIIDKSKVIPIGINLPGITTNVLSSELPVIVWNHRWDNDKNPKTFFDVLRDIQAEGIDFRIVVLGQETGQSRSIFDKAKVDLKSKVLHWGFCSSKEEYFGLLGSGDILPVTSNHDFFGLSVLEAAGMGCHPILPKAMAYPEHFNSDEVSYYQDNQELFNILKSKLISHDATVKKSKLIKYPWEEVIVNYDDLFDVLIH